jgi:hypothetical protein
VKKKQKTQMRQLERALFVSMGIQANRFLARLTDLLDTNRARASWRMPQGLFIDQKGLVAMLVATSARETD